MDGTEYEEKIELIRAMEWRFKFLTLVTKGCKLNREQKSKTYHVVNNVLEMFNCLHKDMEQNPYINSEDLLNFSLMEGGNILDDQPERRKKRISLMTNNIKRILSILQHFKGLRSQIDDLKSDLEQKDQLIFKLQEEKIRLISTIEEGKVALEELKSIDPTKVVNLEQKLKVLQEKYDEAVESKASYVKKIQTMGDYLNDVEQINVDLQKHLDFEKERIEDLLKSIADHKKTIHDLEEVIDTSRKTNNLLTFETDMLKATLLVRDKEKAELQEMLKVVNQKYNEPVESEASNVKEIQITDDYLSYLGNRNQVLGIESEDLLNQNKINDLIMSRDVDNLQKCLDLVKEKNEIYSEFIAVLKDTSRGEKNRLLLEIDSLKATLLVRDKEKAELQEMFHLERIQNYMIFQNTLNNIYSKLYEYKKQRVARSMEIDSLRVKLNHAEDLINAYKKAKDKDEQKLITANNELIAEHKIKEKLFKGLERMKCEYKNLEVSLKVSKYENTNLLLEIEKEKQINKKQQEQFDTKYNLLQHRIGNYYRNL